MAKTGAVATIQVNVLVQVLVPPQAAVAVKVNTCERLQPLLVMLPAEQLTVTAPHSLLAVTAPPKFAIVAQVGRVAGLQPRSMVCPQLAKTGAVATIQVNVLVQVLVPPQAAVAVKVNTCERLQPLLVTVPGEQVTVTAPHSLLAVTAPPKFAIVAHVGRAVGLQPRSRV